jgi:CBS domain containing-hemolysin-like protein
MRPPVRLIRGQPSLGDGVAVALAVVVALLVIASAQLVAGEMVPKFYAIDRAEAVARRIALPLRVFSILFRPMILALTAVSDWILRLVGVDMSPGAARWILGRAQASHRRVPCGRAHRPG